MAKLEITIDDEQMEAISEGNGLVALLRPLLNEALEAEMTEHLGAGLELGRHLEGGRLLIVRAPPRSRGRLVRDRSDRAEVSRAVGS